MWQKIKSLLISWILRKQRTVTVVPVVNVSQNSFTGFKTHISAFFSLIRKTIICVFKKIVSLLGHSNTVLTFLSEHALDIIFKIIKLLWKILEWIAVHIWELFFKPRAELTYTINDVNITVIVEDFIELAPDMIQYIDVKSKKRVKIKSDYIIRYTLKEIE